MSGRLAAVTGATGFLGRHVVQALAADGWRIRVLARRSPPADAWPSLSPEVVAGDLDDLAALDRLCRGADAVLHLAGLTKARRLADFDAVNARGAEQAAQAAARVAPGANFVLVSSLAARQPQLSAYARSKREGEEAVQHVMAGRATVVRPTAIYGPGDRETLQLFRLATASPVLPVLRPDMRLTLIHVADAARAIAALALGTHGGRTVALSDARPEGYGLREVMAVAATAVGRRATLVAVPDLALRAAGGVGDLVRVFGAAPMLSSGKARELLHRDWSLGPGERFDDGPAPRFDLAAGFADTVAAHREAGWLRGFVAGLQ